MTAVRVLALAWLFVFNKTHRPALGPWPPPGLLRC